MKKYELEMLNNNTTLTYNWDVRPCDPEELVLRNTFMNLNSQLNKSKHLQVVGKKKGKRVSWNMNLHVNIAKSMSTIKLNHSSSNEVFRKKLMISVKEIVESTKRKNVKENHIK